jgi:hypothetical protein
LDFYTFKGIKKSIRKITLGQAKNFIYKNRKLKDRILSKPEEHIKLFDKNFIKIYYDLISFRKVLTYNTYINFIILDNFFKFLNLKDLNLLNITRNFKIN